MTKELTGRHVLIIVVASFGVIIAANMTMLFVATGSFPGLVVKNSYVASQGWDARAAAQRDLGWTATVTYRTGSLWVDLTDAEGRPITDVTPVVTIGRPTTDIEDRILVVAADGIHFMADVELTEGRWRVDVSVEGSETFTNTAEILIPGAD